MNTDLTLWVLNDFPTKPLYSRINFQHFVWIRPKSWGPWYFMRKRVYYHHYMKYLYDQRSQSLLLFYRNIALETQGGQYPSVWTSSLFAICMSVHMAVCVCSASDSYSAWLSGVSDYLISLTCLSLKQGFHSSLGANLATGSSNMSTNWLSFSYIKFFLCQYLKILVFGNLIVFLHSSSSIYLTVTSVLLSTVGNGTFSHSPSQLWNSLQKTITLTLFCF